MSQLEQNCQQQMSKFLIIFCAGLICASCTEPSRPLVEKSFFNSSITMLVPTNWKAIAYPEIKMHDPNDTILVAFIGTSKERSVLINVKHRPFIPIQDVSTRHILDLNAKNNGLAKILSVKTETSNNQITVEYLCGYNAPKPLFYFHNTLIITNKKTISFDFQGVDSKEFRDTVKLMAASIKIIKR